MANHPGIARRARWTTLLFCAAVGAHAAEAALEEIIVTAQKRDENVQDIPLTINVVNGAVLDRFNIRDTNDLASSLPGLVIQQTPQNLSQVTVRGLGTGSGGSCDPQTSAYANWEIALDNTGIAGGLLHIASTTTVGCAGGTTKNAACGNTTYMTLQAIPVPAAVWLFGSGLGLLGLARRRRVSAQA